MIDLYTFEKNKTQAVQYPFTSFTHLDYEDCMQPELLCQDEGLILLYDSGHAPAALYYAAKDFQSVVKAVQDITGEMLLIQVPHAAQKALEAKGFAVYAEFVDHFNEDLQAFAMRYKQDESIEFLQAGECPQAAQVVIRCHHQSRGFAGKGEEWLAEWVQNEHVIIARMQGRIAGLCCVSIYGNGMILWIRLIYVDPAFQGQGVGGKLMTQAIRYGAAQGAQRGFLAVDTQNDNAIHLYHKFGFLPREDRGELQMIRLAQPVI